VSSAETETETDYEVIARELVRALRGRRSQTSFSARLAYRSNIVHRWEAGQCWPTAADFLGICAKLRIDVAESFAAFYGRPPAWLDGVDPASAAAVAAFLRDLRGKVPIKTLAEATGYSRFSLSRWLKGKAQPNLPEYLRLIDAMSSRLLDYVATLTAPEKLPSVAARWTRRERARELAYRSPWSHAVLRALELEAYAKQGYREPDWLAHALGMEPAHVSQALEALASSGQIEKRRGRWVPTNVTSVNTGRDQERARRLKGHWSRVAVERLEQGGPGMSGYTLFAISRADLQRLRELQLEYVRAMQAIVTRSEPNECVGLYCVHLLDLRAGEGNALAPPNTRDGN
jgi:DNA-binding transcriptional ArsR family regulator